MVVTALFANVRATSERHLERIDLVIYHRDRELEVYILILRTPKDDTTIARDP